MTKRGRACKLTPSVQERLIEALSIGTPYYQACAIAQISYNTFRNWLLKGESELEDEEITLAELEDLDDADSYTQILLDGRSDFVLFVLAVRQAEALAVETWLKQINKAGAEGNWQAAAWRLERRYPQDFGRQILEHALPVGGIAAPIPIRIVEVEKTRETDDQE